MKSLLYCRDPGKAGQNFIPAKWDHVITPFVLIISFSPAFMCVFMFCICFPCLSFADGPLGNSIHSTLQNLFFKI